MGIKALESPVTLVSNVPGRPIEVDNAPLATPTLELEAINVTSTPGTPQVLITSAVPAGKYWRIYVVELHSRAHSVYSAKINADEFASGKSSPDEINPRNKIDPWRKANAGETITFTYDQATGMAVPVTARIYYSEFTA